MCSVASRQKAFPMKTYVAFSLLFILSSCTAEAWRPPRFLRPRSHNFSFSNGQIGTPSSKHSVPNSEYEYETKNFTQRLDHFSFKKHANSTFQQRYLINDKHWSGAQAKGPIFLYCGNEGYIEWFAVNSGFMWDIAPQFGALLVFPEHRYYGTSMPYGSHDAAYKDGDSLSYLTAEQAIVDFATLILDLKKNLSAEASPVVLFGGSYGGMLAAWMRLKYPHIAIGALASSAPILQFEDIVPWDTFYDIVSNDFRRESENCFRVIKDSWSLLESYGKKDEGLHEISKKFHICRDVNGIEEIGNWLDSAYSNLAMVDYPYDASFLMPLPAYPIREVCKAIDNFPNDADILDRVFAGVSIYYNYTGETKCFDVNDDPHGENGWNWQACTEMVMPMSSNPESSMFPSFTFDLESYTNDCIKSFGVEPRPYWITTEFGGHSIGTVLKNYGSNIIFSNGLWDPWSGGGVLTNISSSIVALVTEKGAHHLDLRQAREDDPAWLVEQRKAEIQIIKDWIYEYYQEKGLYSFNI
ncbi:hypothetical protein SUGI_0537040 [Cryptomeria japonica]|uniref:uncharacterized protein LOC131039522 n=1 Tax=Cryptomeria japonica TaxID=3369 RepID=UPI002408BA7C|nr:uncharacterized protein LOC131039522 [Cryptomeria japonica]GLJ27365.1 hypothetical protein SUGI_0537040 [Cryptomeria japonica]